MINFHTCNHNELFQQLCRIVRIRNITISFFWEFDLPLEDSHLAEDTLYYDPELASLCKAQTEFWEIPDDGSSGGESFSQGPRSKSLGLYLGLDLPCVIWKSDLISYGQWQMNLQHFCVLGSTPKMEPLLLFQLLINIFHLELDCNSFLIKGGYCLLCSVSLSHACFLWGCLKKKKLLC